MVWRCWRANDLFSIFFLEIDLAASYITETVSRKSSDRLAGREFDTPELSLKHIKNLFHHISHSLSSNHLKKNSAAIKCR